ncbi:MAG: hypothetical protein ACRC10_13075 [Thermoguttaceae bacterium]
MMTSQQPGFTVGTLQDHAGSGTPTYTVMPESVISKGFSPEPDELRWTSFEQECLKGLESGFSEELTPKYWAELRTALKEREQIRRGACE